jgi:Exonuclease VII, large subunit
MEITQSLVPAAELPTYSIEGLLQRAGIYGQQKVFTKVEGIVRVKGRVTKVSRYSYACYITLKDGEFSLSVKCDSSQEVSENELVLVEGTLLLRSSNFFPGLECCIYGNIVGNWALTNKTISADTSALKKKRFVSFEDGIGENDLSSVLLLGTEIGITDVLSQLNYQASDTLRNVTIRVNRVDSLLNDIKEANPEKFRALILVRGGDDSTMAIWNDPIVVSFLMNLDIPFYTALGHSHSKTLADQLADAAYHTPTAVGAALNSILVRRQKFKEMECENLRLKQDYFLLTNASQTKTSQSKVGFNWMKAIVILSIYTAVIYFFQK